MNDYIENNLGKDEEIVLKAEKSFLYLVGPILWAVIVLVLAIVANVLVAPYTTLKGVYINFQANQDIRDFDKESKNIDDEEKAEILAFDDVIELMQKYVGNRSKYTWNDYRKATLKGLQEKYEQRWEEDGERFLEDVERAGGLQKAVITAGKYIPIVIWALFLLIGGVPFLKRLLKWLSISLALTNKRVVGKVGILRINTLDFPLDKIDHVQMKGTLFGKIFRYYSLKIVSVGGAGFDNNRRRKKERDQFIGISNAQEFKDMATHAIELHAEEARKAQAAEIARAMGK